LSIPSRLDDLSTYTVRCRYAFRFEIDFTVCPGVHYSNLHSS
jgi:hypothetical protein